MTRLIIGSGEKTLVELDIDGESVVATDSHPIWVDSEGRWVDAIDVRPGDVLLTTHGVTVVDDVDVDTADFETVYNLTVDDLHTFYVLVGDEPILTHNTECDSLVPDSELQSLADELHTAMAAGQRTQRGRSIRLQNSTVAVGEFGGELVATVNKNAATRRVRELAESRGVRLIEDDGLSIRGIEDHAEQILLNARAAGLLRSDRGRIAVSRVPCGPGKGAPQMCGSRIDRTPGVSLVGTYGR